MRQPLVEIENLNKNKNENGADVRVNAFCWVDYIIYMLHVCYNSIEKGTILNSSLEY